MYFSEKANELANRADQALVDVYAQIDRIAQQNQFRVMKAYRDHYVSESCFAGTTGYGYNDKGRDVFEEIVADVFGTEAALARHNFVSGTHALATALFAVLRPGDTFYYVTGAPYDTLEQVIGISGEGMGSLKEFGVTYGQLELNADGKIDYPALESILACQPKLICAQRSRGYSTRLPFSVDELDRLYVFVKEHSPNTLVMVDNCYGEFVEEREPKADMLVGSFIKNPGGGIADTGGYIAGTRTCVDLAAYRITSPGTGAEVGPTLGQTRKLMQGFFLAPHTVAQALKTVTFAAWLLDECGYEVYPSPYDKRLDIVQSIAFHDKDKLIKFCEGIQAGSPVDAFARPEPCDMPGYEDQVIMAAGAFTQGSSIELSADAPIREPYMLYLQGGITFESGRWGVLTALDNILGE